MSFDEDIIYTYDIELEIESLREDIELLDEGEDRLDLEEELLVRTKFKEEVTNTFGDEWWESGGSLVSDSYFPAYAEQMAADIGAINPDAWWPLNCIDWDEAAEQLQMDYTPFEVENITFWGQE